MNGVISVGSGRMAGLPIHPAFFTSAPASRNNSLLEVTNAHVSQPTPPPPRNPPRPLRNAPNR